MSEKSKLSIVPVVLAGGIGSRLWPVSRTKKPKQFCSFFENANITLFDETLLRMRSLKESPFFNVKNYFVMTGEKYGNLILSSHEIQSIKNTVKIFLEPSSRNTLASMTLASLYADEDDILIMLPSDHNFDERAFQCALLDAVRTCGENDAICLIGIVASNPETGYGYIQVREPKSSQSQVREVLSFHEKPNFEMATQFLMDGSFFWNSGIVVVRAGSWREYLQLLRPDVLSIAKAVVSSSIERTGGQIGFDEKLFSQFPKESVDYAVLEKVVGLNLPMYMVPCYGHWSDLGTWKMVYSHSKKDFDGNVLIGDVKARDCKDSYFYSKDRLMVGLGLNNVSIISTPDAILALPTSDSEGIKRIVEELHSENREEVNEFRQDVKPWGEAVTFYSAQNECKVKRLVINPGQSISLQRHKNREEHWIVVSGSGRIVRNDEMFCVKKGDYIYIPKGSIHRIVADKDVVVLIEIQMGAELSEDDIERLDDIYNRN